MTGAEDPDSTRDGGLTRRELEDRWAKMLARQETFAVAFGDQLRKAREDDRRTAEDVARAARRLGLSWHRTTVGQTERGNRAVSAVELLLIPLLYGRPLRDLLPQVSRAIWLTDETALYGGELRRVLDVGYDPGKSGYNRPGRWHFRNAPDPAETLETLLKSASEAFGNWPTDALVKHIATPDETESKAAKRLHTTPEYVAYASRERWGRGLAEERNARLGDRLEVPEAPRALQAARGHVTRELLAELEPRIRELEERRGQPGADLTDWAAALDDQNQAAPEA